MISDPMTLSVTLVGITAAVYAISSINALSVVFKYLPPVVWLYFVPMILATMGFFPSEHPLYSSLAKYALPMALLLLTISTDLKAIASVGVSALLALGAGALGIALGCVTAFFVFSNWLPDTAWQSLTLLSATWIGGSANMVAMQQSLSVEASVIGPLVVVDTVVAYSWLGMLIALSAQSQAINKFLRADSSTLERVEKTLQEGNTEAKLVSVKSLCVLVGSALVVAFLARNLGEGIPELGSPPIITATTWTILIVVTGGLILSFGSVGKAARQHRAAEYAYAVLFLLLTSVGAQADLRAITEAPIFVLVGIFVLAVQVVVLILACRFLRLPAFFVAVGSMANIGGAVSGPIAAAAYRPALAPIGALLGVAGYIVGIYVPLVIAFVLSSVAT